MLIVLMSIVSISAYAQQKTLTIDNQAPGWLSSKISYGDQQTVENLTVTGYLNNEDLRFIVGLAKENSLHGRLDLENANFVGNTNDYNDYLLYSEDIFGSDWDIIYFSYFSYPKSLKGGKTTAGGEDNYRALRGINVDTLFINTTTGFTGALGATVKHLVIGDNVTVLKSIAVTTHKLTVQTVTLPPTLKIIGQNYLTIEDARNLKEYPSLERMTTWFKMNKMPDSIYLPKINYLHMLESNSHVFIGDNIDTITYMKTNIDINLHFSSPKPPIMFEGNGTSSTRLPANTPNFRLYIPKGSANAYRACFRVDGTDVTIIEENVDVKSVTFDKHELSLKVGESETVSFEVLPSFASDKSITWSSDNTDVAVVHNGKVTAKKAGKAIVTATSVSNPEIQDVCEVTVIQPVLAINIVESSITLVQHKDKKQLTAIINPDDATDKTVIWSSTDENVAIVDDNGIVYAKNVGNATIIATSTSNSEITDICEVIVIQPVTSVSMSDATFTFNGIGGIKQLMATVLPEDASDKSVRWDSSNKSVCTVSSSGIIVAVGVGTSVVSVTTIDGGYVAVCIVTVNETNGIMTMDIDTLSGNEKIYDAQGKRIEKLQRGINILRMSDGTTRKVVVK